MSLRITITLLALVGLSLPCRAGSVFVPPAPAQIQIVATNPAHIAVLIKGASTTQAVDVLVQSVEAVVKLKLPEKEQTKRIAIMTAIVFRAFPAEAPDLARLLTTRVPLDILLVMAATASVVMGEDATVVLDAFCENLGESEAQAIRNTWAHPATVLPSDLILSLGLFVPHAGAATGGGAAIIPLAPPIGVQPTPPVQTPPAPRYRGQGQ